MKLVERYSTLLLLQLRSVLLRQLVLKLWTWDHYRLHLASLLKLQPWEASHLYHSMQPWLGILKGQLHRTLLAQQRVSMLNVKFDNFCYFGGV